MMIFSIAKEIEIFNENIENIRSRLKEVKCPKCLKYIHYKDKKAFVADLKGIYKAVNEDVAMENLISLKDKWSNKYHLMQLRVEKIIGII